MLEYNFRKYNELQYDTGLCYSTERNKLILISLLRQNAIKNIIVSPGATNVTFVGSLQHDSYFNMVSCVDERAAAFMAVGMASETGEPVVLSCTGATSSRDYFPALTEAFYKHLPILIVTSSLATCKVNHLYPQVTDRSHAPVDIVKSSYLIQNVKDNDDVWDCNIKINKAIRDLHENGGGPVHLNLETQYECTFNVKELPIAKKIETINVDSDFPILKNGKIAVFIGAHQYISESLQSKIERFCECNNAVVLCDHTSNYYGTYKLNMALVYIQENYTSPNNRFDNIIYIGEISGDYYTCAALFRSEIWRVSLDGEYKDRFQALKYVFKMAEEVFFDHYCTNLAKFNTLYHSMFQEYHSLYESIPELPFSNIWIAQKTHKKLPAGSQLHMGILNSLRAWNFFNLPVGVTSYCNVGGFGIDGSLSSLLGAASVYPQKIYFAVLGDLSFFYDCNALLFKNSYPNVRILLINNSRGTEFRNYSHIAAVLGKSVDPYVAAAGHFGSQSDETVKSYARSLGFQYLSASTKGEYLTQLDQFVNPELQQKPLLFEVLTDSDDESQALKIISSFKYGPLSIKKRIKQLIKQILSK